MTSSLDSDCFSHGFTIPTFSTSNLSNPLFYRFTAYKPYLNFSFFCTMRGLEKLGVVDQNWLGRNFSVFFAENAGRG